MEHILNEHVYFSSQGLNGTQAQRLIAPVLIDGTVELDYDHMDLYRSKSGGINVLKHVENCL